MPVQVHGPRDGAGQHGDDLVAQELYQGGYIVRKCPVYRSAEDKQYGNDDGYDGQEGKGS